MSEELVSYPVGDPPALVTDEQEVEALAARLGYLLGEMLAYYKRDPKQGGQGLSHEEALARRDELQNGLLEELLETPPQELDYNDLERLAEHDPKIALERWNAVKRWALEELRSGMRAADAVQTRAYTRMKDRARFAALRYDFMEAWKPTNGIERGLVDQMAQVYTAYLYWIEVATHWATEPCQGDAMRAYKKRGLVEGEWNPPRLKEGQSMELAAGMAERYSRMFLRLQRSMRDLRRYAPAVVVQNAGQVNVAAQQVSLSNVGESIASEERLR